MMQVDADTEYGPWNPGLRSQIPRKFLPYSTLFNPDNTETGLEEAEELSDFCGLPKEELMRFRAGRLAVHELLIRITADLAVSDGKVYADLGINFRQIASTILDSYVTPQLPEIEARLNRENTSAEKIIAEKLKVIFQPKPVEAKRETTSVLSWLGIGNAKSKPQGNQKTREDRERDAIAEWAAAAQDQGISALERSCARALATLVSSITGKHGRVIGTPDLITRIAVTLVSNSHGSAVVGRVIEPLIDQGVTAEGYQRLPAQDKPVVMNVKGASAAGKSTLRPLQRQLADRINVPWTDFALISPDIWRKFLLDYDSLGEAYKYAGPLSGHELEIIDQKLDAYMAAKGAAGRMSHLLIDRFRFDSFVPESDGEDASKLLTRFGDLVYMFFVITPPEATVERAWKRGLEFGRYKAVDDLLDHNVDAFTGMPDLFFTWALRKKKRVHYEFLDNSVPKGEKPRTVAFGWNEEMTILDIQALRQIDRFRQININAKSAQEVYDVPTHGKLATPGFLERCLRMIPHISFADSQTSQIYASVRDGVWAVHNEELLRKVAQVDETRDVLKALGLDFGDLPITEAKPPILDRRNTHTLGAWN